MLFKITQVSSSQKVEYLPKTKAVEVITTQSSDCSNIANVDTLFYGTWKKLGFNHRIEGRTIKRDFKSIAWVQEFYDLDDILIFIAEHGKVVIQEADSNEEPSYPTIEIYDAERE